MKFDFYRRAQALRDRAEPFATATVVRVEKPTSGTVGDKAIVTADGEIDGWIGGSCARPTVIQEGLAALAEGSARLIRLSKQPDARVGREGITDLSMTCFSGGTMEIYIEPQLPTPRLLVIGDLPVAAALARLGEVMGYEVITVEAYGEGALPGVERVADLKELDEVVHGSTYAVVATHGSYDEVAVERVLRASPAYVGLVASGKRAESILDYVRKSGADDSQIALVRSPAGLDLGGRAPEEIALSILAEIVELRSGQTSVEATPADADVASGSV